MDSILTTIQTPDDLKNLTIHQKRRLCEEIRERLIEVVSRTGGHLASNLGVVELTVALDSVFSSPTDAIIFDVGHQCYTHKLLTGRQDEFTSLRQKDGLSGFPRPTESEHDFFVEGHASTSIAHAIGLAHAKNLNDDPSFTIAVIGDGSLTGGLAYEGMNNITSDLKRLIVILNDNSMSISKSVGSLSNYLMKLRTTEGYLHLKDSVKNFLDKVPVIGLPLENAITNAKTYVRRELFDGTLFEEFGFNYIGPVDGHDLYSLQEMLKRVKAAANGPYFLHVITQKGKGFALAEENPGAYHGVGKFSLDEGNPDISLADSFSNTFGRELSSLAEEDKSLCAITAAMKYGTGLQYFYHNHKERFFDVGIAEGFATAMAAGLAKGGKKPVLSIYSTFLQRAFDQLVHDISLNNANVLLAIDRAGFVGDDGETHQGIYDVALLNAIGTFRVASPMNYRELLYWMKRYLKEEGPRAIRYPRGAEDSSFADYPCSNQSFDYHTGDQLGDILLVSYGREFIQAFHARDLVSDKWKVDLLKLNEIVPIPEEVISILSKYQKVLIAEEGVLSGGVGENLKNSLSLNVDCRVVAIEDTIVQQGSMSDQLKASKLDAESLSDKIGEMMQ